MLLDGLMTTYSKIAVCGPFGGLSQKVILQARIWIFAYEWSMMISFKWRHFKQELILMLVRWHLAYSLSY